MNIYDLLYAQGKYGTKEKYKLNIVKDWLDSFQPDRILDMGCGSGHYIKFLDDYNITGVEPSAFACQNQPWVNDDIIGFEKKNHRRWDALYCMDVLEHIDPDEIEENLKALSKLSKRALFGIANHSDVQDDIELHLIQQDSDWWGRLLGRYYTTVTKTYEPLRYFVFEVQR